MLLAQVRSAEYHISLDSGQRYGPGDAFGEAGPMFSTPPVATVKAETAGALWALDSQTFRQMIFAANRQMMDTKEKFLASVPMFSSLSAEQRATLAGKLEERWYSRADFLMTQGELADALFLIRSGEVRLRGPHPRSLIACGLHADERPVLLGRGGRRP